MAKKKIKPMTKDELLRRMEEKQIPFRFEEQENPVKELGVVGIYMKDGYYVTYAIKWNKSIGRTYPTNHPEMAYGCCWKWMKEFTEAGCYDEIMTKAERTTVGFELNGDRKEQIMEKVKITRQKNIVAYAGTFQDVTYRCRNCGHVILNSIYEELESWEKSDINFCARCGKPLDWDNMEELKDNYVM